MLCVCVHKPRDFFSFLFPHFNKVFAHEILAYDGELVSTTRTSNNCFHRRFPYSFASYSRSDLKEPVLLVRPHLILVVIFNAVSQVCCKMFPRESLILWCLIINHPIRQFKPFQRTTF